MNLENENAPEIISRLNEELYEKYGEHDLDYFYYSTDGFNREVIKIFEYTIWDSENDSRLVVNEEAKCGEQYYESLEIYLRREYNNLLLRLTCRRLNETI